MAFVKGRNSPTVAPTVVTYRSLESVIQVDVYLHSDTKYYLRGITRTGDFFFGPTAGYANAAAATAAVDAVLSPVLP